MAAERGARVPRTNDSTDLSTKKMLSVFFTFTTLSSLPTREILVHLLSHCRGLVIIAISVLSSRISAPWSNKFEGSEEALSDRNFDSLLISLSSAYPFLPESRNAHSFFLPLLLLLRSPISLTTTNLSILSLHVQNPNLLNRRSSQSRRLRPRISRRLRRRRTGSGSSREVHPSHRRYRYMDRWMGLRRNYVIRGGRSMAEIQRSGVRLFEALKELSDLDSVLDRARWVIKNFEWVVELTNSWFNSMLAVFNRKGPLHETILIFHRELMEGGLLKDIMEVGARDLDALIHCVKNVFFPDVNYGYDEL